jgi:hypothetical protein
MLFIDIVHAVLVKPVLHVRDRRFGADGVGVVPEVIVKYQHTQDNRRNTSRILSNLKLVDC